MNDLKIVIAQLNPTLGDLKGNYIKVTQTIDKYRQSDLIVFPELFICGYPPEDLILRPSFITNTIKTIEEIAKYTQSRPAIIIGTPWLSDNKIYNSIALLENGKIQEVRHKYDLPNYGVFDEKRTFSQGPLPDPITFKNVKLGIPICEDIWNDKVCIHLKNLEAEIIISPNGSPFWRHKHQLRLKIAQQRITETGLPLIYANQICGQDELVFDGSSFIINNDNKEILQLNSWEEQTLETNWHKKNGKWVCTNKMSKIKDQFNNKNIISYGNDIAQIYSACVVGLRDYVNKNKFPGVVIGLSGGIDSAICAAIAVDAIGADRVYCVILPSKYTSQESMNDAAICAQNLQIKYDILSIEQIVSQINLSLSPIFTGHEADITEENIQSRTRGVLLMAMANKFNLMLLTTGNKSELSVGYATIYGDMNGGFNPIKDIYKTEVFALAKFRNNYAMPFAMNQNTNIIPENIIIKPPSAELKPEQTDEQTLGSYDELDLILQSLIENELSVIETVAQGFSHEKVAKIQNMLYTAEYKRRQSAPGVKVSLRNLGRDRRYPITNHFRDN